MAGRPRDPGHDDYCLKNYEYLFQRDILQGKVAFITGGGSGIGFRIAEIFMRHGCDTVIASRRLEKVEEVSSKINKSNANLVPSSSMSFMSGAGIKVEIDSGRG